MLRCFRTVRKYNTPSGILCRAAFFHSERMRGKTAMEKKRKISFGMFLVTIGIVYGDIGTSPLYVMKSILEGNGGIAQVNEEFILGALSLIIWTITLLTTVKYVLIAMRADNNGEGGIFSLYALVKKVAPWLIFPAMLGGAALLAATGAEALYSDMGHVGRGNIYASWPFVKACLILNYLGQGAWILTHTSSAELAVIPDMNPFFQMLPPALRAPAVALGALAAIIASQALITGSYTLVSEAIRLDLMPHLEVRYPSDTKGQIYIGAVNTVLYLGCAAVVLYFRTSARMESAYGLAITVTMLMTTLLLAVYLWNIRKKRALAVIIALVFGAIEAVFFVSSLSKFAHGGYVAVLMALVLFLIMVVWRRGTQLEQEYATRLPVRDYLPNLDTLHEDAALPPLADNLVFLDKAGDMDTIDRDILYSILDKDPKRAAAYWFISMNVTDEPDTRRYSVETYGTDYIFRVRLDLGFKCHQRVNVYLRQIVRDLIESGELPPQERKYSIYGKSDVGSFKFIFLHKAVPSKSELSFLDELVLNTKYAIRRVAGSKVRWYGLDTSSLVVETVPLIVGGKAPRSSRLERV